ncbi:hypothetical protein HanIR_Chr17g0884731 [Helianthus annuus]|nr:hypothetical protein HanIR_Chr17g0884731 [Helianthus annuus]
MRGNPTSPPEGTTMESLVKFCLPSKTNRCHVYSHFTWMPQKITGRVGVEHWSQGTPSVSAENNGESERRTLVALL